MQLLIILALLLYGGKPGARDVLSEMKPVLESLGGEELKDALKSAEEISEVLSAVHTFAGSMNGAADTGEKTQASSVQSDDGEKALPAIAFPLSPIVNIADRDITYSLSKYISQN